MSEFFEVRPVGAGQPNTYQATVDDEWRYADRIFGGYTTALALYCAWLSAPLPVLASTYAMFLNPISAGPLTAEVTTLRAGRSASARRVLLSQRGTTVLSCDAWFLHRAPRPMSSPSAAPFAPDPAPDPDRCERVGWLGKLYPFMDAHFETRALSYPATPGDSTGSHGGVALWSRPLRDWDLPPEVTPWITDVLLLDAYLLDPALWRYGMETVTGYSLDLSISWSGLRPSPTPWTRMEATAHGDGDFLVCTGQTIDGTGTARTHAVQHGKLTITDEGTRKLHVS